ncbi:unnamed protein product [Paramecium sonneborni]|uniref:Uncharacterized protein n=1 Tax=Paramecium sonneborni TaxID=65129 RepID=A0A8S1R2C7_9CILI|nr:unnamed protein product [Paramecium sonneborni]
MWSLIKKPFQRQSQILKFRTRALLSYLFDLYSPFQNISVNVLQKNVVKNNAECIVYHHNCKFKFGKLYVQNKH